MTSGGPAPGWMYDPDDFGRERYWNGEAWTEHRRPLQTAMSQPASEMPTLASPTELEPVQAPGVQVPPVREPPMLAADPRVVQVYGQPVAETSNPGSGSPHDGSQGTADEGPRVPWVARATMSGSVSGSVIARSDSAGGTGKPHLGGSAKVIAGTHHVGQVGIVVQAGSAGYLLRFAGDSQSHLFKSDQVVAAVRQK